MRSTNPKGFLAEGAFATAMFLMTSIAGCGGGGGDGSNANMRGSGVITVAVTDAFGRRVANADVYASHPRGGWWTAHTDNDGTATIRHVANGRISVTASMNSVDALAAQSAPKSVDLPAHGNLELPLTLDPLTEYGVLGLVASVVDATAVSTDGRSVTFSLDVAYETGLQTTTVSVFACTAGASGAYLLRGGVCLADDNGPIEAQYTAASVAKSNTPATTPEPFAATLLVDQSASFAANDSSGLRFVAAKYFALRKPAHSTLNAAAFAIDDSTGTPALIPATPATFYPVDTPRFTAVGSETFGTFDELANAVGGAAPLYSAINRAIDFTLANADPSVRRIIVAMTGAVDEECVTSSACESARRALAARLAATGIEFVSVGVSPDFDSPQSRGLDQIADLGGAVLLANRARSLGGLMGSLPDLLGRAATIEHATFELRSDDGTFVSGRTVFGTLSVEGHACPMDCPTLEFPFRVRVP